ncbi:MAG: glycosyltransferase [Bacteroidales bacterium]|nr:glycosyltransferase [Bacteroidales bacterium]
MWNNILEVFTNYTDWKFWLISLFLLSWLIQMLYYIFVFSRIGRRKKQVPYNSPVPVSVVICAKNEEENLRERLKYVLEQDYPDFEVVVVNDQSTDDTEMILDEYKQKYKNLYVTEISHNNFRRGKKLALTIGIKAAKNEWLLLTDADCIPASKNWIRQMSQHFTDGNDIVLGYGGYEERNTFVNKLIRYDAGFVALQYYTYCEAGMPYMGVGRNLAYRKSLFMGGRGFASHSELMSGDDDLFVNENAKGHKVALAYNPESFTTCVPKETFYQWNVQKQRHFTASERYRGGHKFVLAMEPFFRSLFYMACVAMALFDPLYWIAAAAFVARFAIFQFTMCSMAKKFKMNKVAGWALLFDIILPWINLVQMILGNHRKERLKWK